MSAILLGQSIPDPPSAWVPVVLLLLIGIGFAIGNLILSIIVGPRRQGQVKAQTYESGMVPTGDARRRFNVRFYLVAVIFLVFDVEIVFFYPWATLFPQVAMNPDIMVAGMRFSTLLLVEMFVFVMILLVAYLYAWGKGVFRWD